MLEIGSTIVSLDIVEKHFVCDLAKCRGMCCVLGESGAPLEDDEIEILTEILPKVKPFMTAAGISAIEKKGVYEIDFDNDKVTTLINDSEDCAFAFREKEIVYCAIEKAFTSGEIDFRKPVSCHLYPVRITKYKEFDAVNVHYWKICDDALTLGKKEGTPLYVFLKEPLIRKYGKEWYEKLIHYGNIIKSMGAPLADDIICLSIQSDFTSSK